MKPLGPIVILLLSWLVNLGCAPPALAQKGDIAVVVNTNNPVSNLTVGELRSLFAGDKQSWRGGVAVKPFVRAPGTQERVALLKLLGLSEGEYRQNWMSRIFRGEVQEAPPTLPSNGMQKEAVAAFSGGIALMSLQDVKPGMKVVRINGHLPGEPAYPLH
jgi:ABC-type phosphate transport system substrate-binding protein